MQDDLDILIKEGMVGGAICRVLSLVFWAAFLFLSQYGYNYAILALAVILSITGEITLYLAKIIKAIRAKLETMP